MTICKIRAIACIVLLATLCGTCWAATGSWSSGTGLFATGEGDRVVYSIAVSPDDNSVYCGTGSGTVFSLTVGLTQPPATSAPSATQGGSGSESSGSGSGSGSSGSSYYNSGKGGDTGGNVPSAGDGGNRAGGAGQFGPTNGRNGDGNAGGTAPGSGGPGAGGGTSQAGTGMPFPMTAVLISTGCVTLAGGGWYLRRWWMKRYDPLRWGGNK